MASVTRFIERRLRLKVNTSKSAVARPEERHFLGFSLRACPGSRVVEVLLSERSVERLSARIVELTPRGWGNSIRVCIRRLNAYLRGWLQYFGICTRRILRFLRRVDAHIRRRLRAIHLHDWKRKRTIARRLIQLGTPRTTAWRNVYEGRKSLWRLSRDRAVHKGLGNAYFQELGLFSLANLWQEAPPGTTKVEGSRS
jgi:hypothetical protein